MLAQLVYSDIKESLQRIIIFDIAPHPRTVSYYGLIGVTGYAPGIAVEDGPGASLTRDTR